MWKHNILFIYMYFPQHLAVVKYTIKKLFNSVGWIYLYKSTVVSENKDQFF